MILYIIVTAMVTSLIGRLRVTPVCSRAASLRGDACQVWEVVAGIIITIMIMMLIMKVCIMI